MRQITKLFALISILLCANVSAQTNSLQQQRVEVVKQYIKFLGQGNYQTIPSLFTQNAIAISSSGLPDHPVHFYEKLFTKTISNPHSSLINIFSGTSDKSMIAAYFDFSWKDTKGKKVSAKFLNLFVFEDNTAKIKNLFVFSNSSKQDVMKQLGLSVMEDMS
jgi:hypothetical protein